MSTVGAMKTDMGAWIFVGKTWPACPPPALILSVGVGLAGQALQVSREACWHGQCLALRNYL